MKNVLLFVLLFLGNSLFAQSIVEIDLIRDDNRSTSSFKELLEAEIQELLGQRYQLRFNDRVIPMDNPQTCKEAIQASFASSSDLLITLGFISSSVLDEIGSYPKPCIGGISLQQGEQGVSGIENYTFIESPFSLEDDLKVFKSIYDFKHLALFIESGLESFVQPALSAATTDFDIQFIAQTNSVEQDLAALNDNIDAVYFLPFSYDQEDKAQQLIDGINDRKIASFSLLGRRVVKDGALASIASDDNIRTYARRLAINTMKILEGENPKDFSVKLDGMQEDFVINVQTMKAIELFPPLEILARASLINPTVKNGREMSLLGAIARALEQNLEFQSQKKNIAIQETEVGIAQSNILPQLTLSSSLANIDQNSAELLVQANQVTPQTSWAGNLQLSQVIYSEPALANITLQKMLKKPHIRARRCAQYDKHISV